MPDPRFVATISARGQKFTAWESVMVRRDFHDGISVFEFVPAENAYGKRNTGLILQPGDPVAISLGGQQVINGHVTTRSVAFDAKSHQVVIAGKSLTADAKDSSVPVTPGVYDGYTMQQVAQAVLAPHGIGLVVKNPPAIFSKPFESLRLNYGETVAELINRMAEVRGVFVTDDANGNCVVGQGNPGAAIVAELQEGRNILRATGVLDDQTAFSKYAAVSQTSGADGSPPRDFSASAIVGGVRSNRTKLWISQHPVKSDELQANVGLEVSKSLWNRVNCTITVVGWQKDDGTLWEPTDNVTVSSPSIFPGGNTPPLGIQSVTFSQNSQDGTTTTLDLVLPWFLTSNPTAGLSDTGGQGAGTGSAAAPAPSASPPQVSAPRADPPDWSADI